MIVILDIAGTAEVLATGEATWRRIAAPYPLRVGDRFRTRELSRATVRLSDLSQVRLGELSEFQVQPAPDQTSPPVYRLWRGILYFFHRDRPGPFRFETPQASAAVRGTEFTLEFGPNDRTVLTLLDGEVAVRAGGAEVNARTGDRVVVEPGRPPVAAAILKAELRGAVQWCLDYPAVLDLHELALTEREQQLLQESLASYRSGDLLQALSTHPGPDLDESDNRRLYRATLLLAVGEARRADELFQTLLTQNETRDGSVSALADALHRLIAVTRDQIDVLDRNAPGPHSATACLVESYVSQARAKLPEALHWAHRAVELSPEFGFGWVRVAELEFSFGATTPALWALERGRKLCPRYAPALVLRGFLLSGENRRKAARASFEEALALDGSLSHAWLGRGLCRVHDGQLMGGLQDLQTAVVTEPTRALLRSYLGKAYEQAGRDALARRELSLAMGLDPLDPTPWLYSALLRQEHHQFNQAIEDLERSIELNDHRAIYRSRLLLDQDRAVRSSSLAGLYQAAGLPEVSLREAVRAESAEYANYSAHLFVSDSFQALREPTRSNLRYETVWFSEMLLANLLAPAGGTPLALNISQQEYTRLFERNRVGLASATVYRSDGQIGEIASQFGTVGDTSWALDLDYAHHDGVRVNNELNRIEWYSTLKQQFTARDSALFLAKYQDFHSGDVFQYYSPTNARPHYAFDEQQQPILAGGYHHEWGPGLHTLALGTWLQSDVLVTDLNAGQWVRIFNGGGQHVFNDLVGLDVRHAVGLQVYGAEAQQILENEYHALLLGARAQAGDLETHSRLSNPDNYAAEFPSPPAAAHFTENLWRGSAYVYETLKFPFDLRVTGGLTYEHLEFPENFRHPPVAPGQETRERLLPKVALTWELCSEVTWRGAWLQSLGGASLDESYRLEPTQLAGFVQDYRTLIPESLASSVTAPDHDVYGAALDLRLKTRTYVTLQGQVLRSEISQSVGAFDYFLGAPVPPRISSTTLREHLDFQEDAVALSVSQLLADEWTLGARYEFQRSDLETHTPGLASLTSNGRAGARAELQQLGFSVRYQHASGWFGQAAARWCWQKNLGPSAALANDSFPQVDLYAGYRLPRQWGDLTVGVLNLTDQDYHLNPVNVHPEFPRERVFYVRARFTF
jgi:tetratricopeptide (TPR) repeat protein